MSGSEIIGIAAAVLGFLESVMAFVERARDAHERQKELGTVLHNYHYEITTIVDIIKVVKDEDTLQTAAVTSRLVDMESIARRMAEFLETLKPGDKGTIRQFAHQLVRGSEDERKLAKMMGELSRAKADLSLRIQVANVGLTRSVGDSVVASVATIQRVDYLLQSIFGKGQGLRIASLLNRRLPHSDGIVALDGEDFEFLGGDAQPSCPTTRIVLNNVTLEQALQINGPVGEKGWREASHLEIKDNQAKGSSIQVNHAVSLDVFERLLAARATTATK